MAWHPMKPETIVRRAAERVADDQARTLDLRLRLRAAAEAEAAVHPEDLWIYGGPEGMLAEHIAAHPDLEA